MIFTLLYILLAALGLSVLIFIHELGHYWMARREGMTVEAFSIGFGKPIRVFERKGVKWQICCLPFGGYVRIAGMEKKGALEPSQIPDGFFGKKPAARIRVALAGPIVNIVFAFLVFCLLWVFGGREKPFSEFTRLIGWIDSSSALYEEGVRPGDEIAKVNAKPLLNFQSLLYAAVFNDTPPEISGLKIDYLRGVQLPFEYRFDFPNGASVPERINAIFSVVHPASFLIYNHQASLPFEGDSPMKDSGIKDGDRILWVDGELMFSVEQLIQTINQPKALLTVQRKESTFLSRVPRLKISDLRLNLFQKAELEDWQHEAKIKGRLTDLFFVPYNLAANGSVQGAFSYLNAEAKEQQPKGQERFPLEEPLLPGDRIIAVDGIPVHSAYEMMNLLQERHLQIIVKKAVPATPVISWKNADDAYVAGIPWKALGEMLHSIGTANPIKEQDDLKLLNPVIPKTMRQISLPEKDRERMEAVAAAQEKAIEKIEDPKAQAQAMQMFEASQNQLKLGIVMVDRRVNYNPSPFVLLANVFQDTWKTILNLFSGNLSPKYMQGPVGIITVMQQSWGVGVKEALFWLGMISLNLGILNLLPIPVLDGGHICFSLWEWVTGKPIKAKTMERLIIPFIILLIALFIYLTYNDLMRLFTGFFKT